MKKSIVLYLVVVGMSLIYGCDGSTQQMSQADCQQQYENSKNKALDAYENCSRSYCNGQVIMQQGVDPCTLPCFKDLQAARQDIDMAMQKCMGSIVN